MLINRPYQVLFLKYLLKGSLFGWVVLLCSMHIQAQTTILDAENLKRKLVRTKTETERLPILNNLTACFLDNQPDSAKKYAERAYKIRNKALSPREKVRTIMFMGVALQKTEVHEINIRPYFQESIQLAKKIADDTLLADIWFRFGDFCHYRGKLEEAVLYYEKAHTYYKLHIDMFGVQSVYHKLAIIYNQQGKVEKSLGMYQKALEILRKLKLENLTGILSDIGNVYYGQGNFVEALKYYKQGLDASTKYADIYGQGFCLNNIGLVHGSLGNHDEALAYHLESLKKREQAQSQEGVSNSYNNIGHTYMLLGHHEKGRGYIKKSLEIDKKLGNQNAVAMDFDLIAYDLLEDKKYEEALQQYNEALKTRIASGHALGVGISYSSIGVVYMQKTNYEQAIVHFKKADSLFVAIGAEDFLTSNNLHFATAYFASGNFNDSEPRAQSALQSAMKRKTKQEIMEASQILAQIFAKKGTYQQAYTYQMQALAYKDSLNIEEKNKKVFRMQALFEFKQQEQDLREKDVENKKLKIENTYQEKVLLLYYILLIVLFFSFFALVAVIYFVWRVGKKNIEKTKQLVFQNEEIRRQGSEIATQSNAIETKNHELQTAHEKLSEANQELIDSIAYAHRIQKAVLPTKEEMLHTLPIHFILYKPRNVVSGDFYWFSEKENHTVVSVMDCTGHGIPGAFMSLIGSDLLHEIVNVREIIEPSSILTELKKRVNSALKQHSTHGRDGMDIGICVIEHAPAKDEVHKKLFFAAAHLTLIYFQDREQKEFEGSKIYIGGYDPDETEKCFETKTLVLDKPTACYLFSDGFQDQFAAVGRKKFTKKRLKAILTDVHLQTPEIQHEILEETIDGWKGNAEQTDDIIVFGLSL